MKLWLQQLALLLLRGEFKIAGLRLLGVCLYMSPFVALFIVAHHVGFPIMRLLMCVGVGAACILAITAGVRLCGYHGD